MFVQTITIHLQEFVKMIEVVDANSGPKSIRQAYDYWGRGEGIRNYFAFCRTFNTENPELNRLTVNLYVVDNDGEVGTIPYVEVIDIQPDYAHTIDIVMNYSRKKDTFEAKIQPKAFAKYLLP